MEASLIPPNDNPTFTFPSVTKYAVNGMRTIGRDFPTYVIAEMSCNHLGSYERAEEIVRAAADAGADCLKMQTYTGDTITLDCDKPWFRLGYDGVDTQWGDKSLHELFQKAHTPWEWQPKLMELSRSLGMDCFSSPFDHTAVDFLESLDVPMYKIASMEIVDLPLVKKVAATGKPVIVSTGMASIQEIDETVQCLKTEWKRLFPGKPSPGVCVLRCVSAYPTKIEDTHLRTIPAVGNTWNVVPGLSDHTLTTATSVAAVALGARCIEKHLTMARSLGGEDATFSIEPDEFKKMMDDIRIAESALGHVHFGGSDGEVRIFRRSIFVTKDMKKGEQFVELTSFEDGGNGNVRSIRPGSGMHSRHMPDVVGKYARCDIEKGTPMNWDLISSTPEA
jgi:pseudaminic acid synthase